MEIKLLFLMLIIIIFLSEYTIPMIFKFHCSANNEQKPVPAIGMGLIITFIITISSFFSYFFIKYLLMNINNKYLNSILFFLTVILFAQLIIILNKKFNSKFSGLLNDLSIGIRLTANLMINCILLGVSIVILNIKYGFIASDSGFFKNIIQALVTGISFTIILVLFAGIRERLKFAEIHIKLKGFFISLTIAFIMAMAFYGFSGILI